MSQNTQRILILGGGFGGVYTARYLEKFLSRKERKSVQLALVNKENYIVFQPLLPEVVSGSISPLNTIAPVRRLLKETRLYTREIEAIDLEKKRVFLSPGLTPRPFSLDYDHLVICLGLLLNASVVPGSLEHGIPFRYLGDALRLRNHTVGVLEEAEIEKDESEKRKLLTFVIVGGGFSGVECAAELASFLSKACRAYHNLRPEEIRIILLQSGKRILPEVDEGLARYSSKILRKLGIEIRLDTRLKALTPHVAVALNTESQMEERIPTRTAVVTVPAGPHPLLASLPVELERGRIKVSNHLEVPNYSGVWALGDCAIVPQINGAPSPPTAQFAIRQARTCAQNILATIRNNSLKPFTFKGLGALGSLGPGRAIANILGVKLTGFAAWVLWRAVYLSKFPGFDRKLRVLSDWIHDIILPKDISQVKVFPTDAIAQEHFEPGEEIFRSGDLGDKIYFVVRGEVDVFQENQFIRTIGEGGLFGEIALISDTPRTATIRAKCHLDLVSVSSEAFKKILKHLPGVRESMDEIMKVYIKGETWEEIPPEELVKGND